MKKNSNKGATSKKELNEYEMKRLETMRKNFESMKAKGCGTLARKLFQANTTMYNANNIGDEGFCTDAEEYIPNDEDNDNDDFTRSKEPIAKSGLWGTSLKRKIRCMSDYLPLPIKQQQPWQQNDEEVSNLLEQNGPTKNPNWLPSQHQSHDEPPSQYVQPNQHQKQSIQHQRQPTEHEHPVQQQQKKKRTTYCTPGAMSSYRDLRKKQMQLPNESRDNVHQLNESPESENLGNVHASNEGHENTQAGYTNNFQQRCDELMEVESQRTTSNSEITAPKKKGRGPTLLTHAHQRTLEERPTIILNSYGQPVGPNKKLVSEYSLFLGTMARNPEYVPLNYCDWPSVPDHTKNQVWDYVQRKYLVSSKGKDWALETVHEQWKCWKCRCKALYYSPYATFDERWCNRPNTIPANQFKELLHYWDYEATKEESERNSSNRQFANDMHTMGPTSFAYLREKLKQEDPNKEEPSKAKLYSCSRQRKPGKSYKTSYDETAANIEQMEAIQSQQCEGSSNHQDPYGEVIKKPEHSGRVRLYGKGVTKTDLKKGGKSSSYIFPEEYIQSVESQVVERLLQSNPELQKLLQANPGVKLVLPSMSRDASNSNPVTTESNEPISMGAQSNNQLVPFASNNEEEVDNA